MKRILIVEDNGTNMYLICFILRNNGYEMAEAKCGEEGVEVAIKEYPTYDEDKVILITAQTFHKDDRLWIRTTVEGHGTGIPKDIMDKMFDPFFTTKPRDVGTGLGFSISHGIARDHKGALVVESEPE